MKKYKIGYACGVFDMFHVGHLNLLEKCQKMCDYLIIGVCSDNYVYNIKNKTPIYSEEERLRIINALKCVNEAVIVDIDEILNKKLVWEKFHFDVIFNGDDWKGSERFSNTEKQFSEIGVDIVYFPYTKGVSTTALKNKIKHLENKK